MTSYPIDSPAMAKALRLIHGLGGVVNTSQVLDAGVHPRTLYTLRDTGRLECLSRGIYHLVDHSFSDIDITTVCMRSPKAVICLLSALSFHELTTVIPSKVSIALPKGSETPCINYPPITVHRFSDECYTVGIIERICDGVVVKVYNPEKTIADCFKFRYKLGQDVVLEALKLYCQRPAADMHMLMEYARLCRVANVISPYLEMIMAG